MKTEFCEIDSEREIRILRLWPGPFWSPLRGQLRVEKLKPKDEPTQFTLRPLKYQALSYTWGSWDELKTIQIDGGWSIPITQNLFTALQHLRGRVTSQDFWVDQICIDQTSIHERNHQVKLMGEIYRHASRVLVWLGTARFPSRLTGRRERLRWTTKSLSPYMAAVLADEALGLQNPPWHSRGWVVQEVLLATRQPLICVGKFRLRLTDIGKHGSCHEWASAREILSVHGRDDKPGDLLGFADIMQATRTKDPRDKIYSLMNLLQYGTRELIHPDYRASVTSVYAQATVAHMTAHKTLNFLGLATVSCRRHGRDPIPKTCIDQKKHSTWVVAFGDLPKNRVRFVRQLRLLCGTNSWCRLRPLDVPIMKHFDLLGTAALSIRGLRFDKILKCTILDDFASNASGKPSAMRFYPVGVSAERAAMFYDPSTRREPKRSCPYTTLQKETPSLPSATEYVWETFFAQMHTQKGSKSRLHGGFTLHQLLGAWTTWQNPTGSPTLNGYHEMEMQSKLDLWYSYFEVHPRGGPQKKLYLTASGFLGIGAEELEVGDTITLPYGSPAPVILQQQQDETFKFIGFTYVHGIMEQELMAYPELELEERDFVLV